jgi:hypothetical protein
MQAATQVLGDASLPLDQVSASLKPLLKELLALWTFVPTYGEPAKRDFLLACSRALVTRGNQSDALCVDLLACMRALCREKAATEVLVEPEAQAKLLELSRLSESAPVAGEVSEEAIKVLSNLLMHQRSIAQEISRVGAVQSCLKKWAKTRSVPSLFPLSRVVFFLAVEGILKKSSLEHEAFSEALKIIAFALQHAWPELENALVECLKIAFQTSMHLGPLNGSQTPPTLEEVSLWKDLIVQLEAIFALPAIDRWDGVKTFALNCVINTPFVCTVQYDPAKTLPAFLRELKVQLAKPDNAPESLTPILLVLTSIARDLPTARRLLKSIIFPVETPMPAEPTALIDTPPEVANSGSLGAALIAHMTSAHTALNYYCNEFIFQLCDEDANKVIALTGFGPAAGLFHMRGLFGFGTNLTKDVKLPASRPERPANLTADFEANAIQQERRLQELERKVSRDGYLAEYRKTGTAAVSQAPK